MRNITINGVKFSTFEHAGETYLCTGNPTGKFQFDYAGEFNDYYTVEGATSVVSGNKSVEDLYEEWLDRTEFYRSIGIRF
jgi:hypothetical protein